MIYQGGRQERESAVAQPGHAQKEAQRVIFQAEEGFQRRSVVVKVRLRPGTIIGARLGGAASSTQRSTYSTAVQKRSKALQ